MTESTISLRPEINEFLAGSIRIGGEIVALEKRRAQRPSGDELLARAERRVSNAKLELQVSGMSRDERRDAEDELTRAEAALAEVQGGCAEDDRLSDLYDSFHDCLTTLDDHIRQEHAAWLAKLGAFEAGTQGPLDLCGRLMKDVGTALSWYRCPDPESPDGRLHTRAQRVPVLVERLQSLVGNELATRLEIERRCGNYRPSININGLSNREAWDRLSRAGVDGNGSFLYGQPVYPGFKTDTVQSHELSHQLR